MDAPPTTLIRTLTLERFLGRWSQWDSAIIAGESRVLETCSIVAPQLWCERGDNSGVGTQNAVTFQAINSPTVSLRVRCVSAGGCVNGALSNRAWVSVYRGTAQIEDPAPPTIGPLTGSFSDSGWHRGTDTVNVSASDASGVKTLRMFAASTELGRKDGMCDYARMKPCPGVSAASFSVDTSTVPDGTHELKVTATDAANQEATATGTLRVDRHAPAMPVNLAAAVATDGTYQITWKNPDQGTASPIVGAHVAVCDPAPALTCSPGQRTAGPGIEQVKNVAVASGQQSVRVWLEDEAGNVDPGNSSVVPVRSATRVTPRLVETQPPILLPSGPAPSSRIKVTKARRAGRSLIVSGTIARGASARVTAKLSRTRTGKTQLTGRTTPRQGKWSIRVTLTASTRNANALYLTLSFAGQDAFRKTTLTRKLSRKAPRSGSTASEFSVETGR